MKRYILTGAPGAGKTAILRWLECDGFTVVEEAATDVIALRQAQGEPEPWTKPSFVDAITALQRRRQEQAAALPGELQLYDRSPVCTYALAVYLGHPVTPALSGELERIRARQIYDKRVLFVENLGFVTPTDARLITFEESLRFEQVHREAYTSLGYECVSIPLACCRTGWRRSGSGSKPQREGHCAGVDPPDRQRSMATMPTIMARLPDSRVRADHRPGRPGVPAERLDHPKSGPSCTVARASAQQAMSSR